MNTQEFQKIIEDTVAEIHRLSTVKGGEYAGDIDRLENFRRNARDIGVSPELIWRVYCGKHWDAITQYVNDLVNKKERVRGESISGRIDDCIVYLILLKAILIARANGEFGESPR